VKVRPTAELPFLAAVPVTGTTGAFAKLRSGGFVPRPHLEPAPGDAAAQAARLAGAPYLWGGRSAWGLDCSALVQLALLAAGVSAPRDSDMQAAMLGHALAPDAELRRGDLVFWKGHVGMLADAATLIHANAHHMAVVIEPLAEAVARIAAAGGGPVAGRRRLR
jgi:cell wall-associated NlpC family hydrolase